MHNKPKETNQKPAGGFLIAHFKRYAPSITIEKESNMSKKKQFGIAFALASLVGILEIRVSS